MLPSAVIQIRPKLWKQPFYIKLPIGLYFFCIQCSLKIFRNMQSLFGKEMEKHPSKFLHDEVDDKLRQLQFWVYLACDDGLCNPLGLVCYDNISTTYTTYLSRVRRFHIDDRSEVLDICPVMEKRGRDWRYGHNTPHVVCMIY